jgi:nucleotide-binding universal stress UspA family protein
MYRKIVVGYRRGERGPDALALGRVLAGSGPVEEVLVVEVLPTHGSHQRDVLPGGVTDDWPPGVRVGARAEHGESAAQTLTAVAEREQADVVVLGSTHRHFPGRILGGTTAGSILPKTRCPVVVAPVDYAISPAPLDDIAVAFDGSDEARAALDWAAGVAAAASARLRLVGVVSPPVPIDSWGANVPSEAWSSGLSYTQAVDVSDALRERMDHELADAAKSAGCATDVATIIGEPARELRDVAAEVDMLVVGAHRQGPLSAALFGSVSHGLAHSCPAPLAIVPPSK